MEDKKKNETRQSTMQNRMENMNGQKPKTISIVISVYNEEKALHEFYREATPVFEALPWNYELIFQRRKCGRLGADSGRTGGSGSAGTCDQLFPQLWP